MAANESTDCPWNCPRYRDRQGRFHFAPQVRPVLIAGRPELCPSGGWHIMASTRSVTVMKADLRTSEHLSEFAIALADAFQVYEDLAVGRPLNSRGERREGE